MMTQPKNNVGLRYDFRSAGDKEGELFIYDDIGEGAFSEGVTGKSFAKDLKELGDIKTLNVRINSVGGSVFDGQAIYSILNRSKARVVAHIDGAALSAASFIAMAADEINIAENGVMMIHDPWGVAMGDAGDMRKTADTLDKLRDTIASVYVARTGKDRDTINQMMADETWMDAHDAIENGFADTMTEAKKAAASVDVTDIYNVPERFRARFAITEPEIQPADKEQTMKAETPTIMAAAEYASANPDAVKDWKNEGFKEGHDEATKELQDRAKALNDAFADRPAFAFEQFMKGNDVAAAKVELADIVLAENAELRKVNADLIKKTDEGAAGSDPVNLDGAAKDSGGTQPQSDDPQVVAEWEWDNDEEKRKGFSNKDRYVAIRKAELAGSFRVRSN